MEIRSDRIIQYKNILIWRTYFSSLVFLTQSVNTKLTVNVWKMLNTHIHNTQYAQKFPYEKNLEMFQLFSISPLQHISRFKINLPNGLACIWISIWRFYMWLTTSKLFSRFLWTAATELCMFHKLSFFPFSFKCLTYFESCGCLFTTSAEFKWFVT